GPALRLPGGAASRRAGGEPEPVRRAARRGGARAPGAGARGARRPGAAHAEPGMTAPVLRLEPGGAPDPAPAGARLEVAGLRKRFGRLEVLQGVDLTLAPGRVTALVGPNGAGKST